MMHDQSIALAEKIVQGLFLMDWPVQPNKEDDYRLIAKTGPFEARSDRSYKEAVETIARSLRMNQTILSGKPNLDTKDAEIKFLRSALLSTNECLLEILREKRLGKKGT